jgi:hypothetical protein
LVPAERADGAQWWRVVEDDNGRLSFNLLLIRRSTQKLSGEPFEAPEFLFCTLFFLSIVVI